MRLDGKQSSRMRQRHGGVRYISPVARQDRQIQVAQRIDRNHTVCRSTGCEVQSELREVRHHCAVRVVMHFENHVGTGLDELRAIRQPGRGSIPGFIAQQQFAPVEDLFAIALFAPLGQRGVNICSRGNPAR